MELDFQECGQYKEFNPSTDVLVVDETTVVPEGIEVIRVKGLTRSAIVRSYKP